MEDPQKAFEKMAQAPAFLLLKQGVLHLGVWVLAFSLFAASDSWAELTGWAVASLLNVLTGIIAGVVTVNLAHEWFHYLGAKLSSSTYTLKNTPGYFIFDWDFEKNDLRQFYAMSIGGTLGGALALMAVFNMVDANNAGRCALIASAVASFAFASIIEWPVLARTRHSRNPQAELFKLSPSVLARAAAGGAIFGVAGWMLLV